jgi:hypothetical protein
MADLTATVMDDVLGPISDLPAADPHVNLTATVSDGINVSDTLPVITDSPSATLINMETASQRWVAPVSITARSEYLEPLFLAAHAVRHPDRYYEPRIKSYGTFTRAISAPVGFVKTGDGSLTILDADNSVRQRIAMPTYNGAAVEVRLGPEGGSLEGFLRPISRQIGIIGQPADGELSFPMQDSISEYLEQKIPNLIDLNNFPLLPEGNAGEFAPIIFGHVSADEEMTPLSTESGVYFTIRPKSYVDSPNGAIRAIYVNKEAGNHLYLVARHPCRSIRSVYYKPEGWDTWVLVSPGDWEAVTLEIPSGETCQMIKFAGDPHGLEVRANVEGIFSESDRYTFAGFYGYASPDDYITNIGLRLIDTKTGNVVYSNIAGTNTNPANLVFQDGDIPEGSRISAIKVWVASRGYTITGLQLEYTDAFGTVTEGALHGPAGGNINRFEIIEGEQIIGISGYTGEHVDELTIISNLVPVTYGGEAGHETYETFVDQSQGVNFADAIMAMLTDYIGIIGSMDKINLASFGETKTRVEGLICAGAITEQITWGEAITRLQRSSNIDLFADKNDRLTVRYTTSDDTPSANLSDLLRLYKGTVKQQLAGPTYNQIPYRYSQNYASDKWTDGAYDNLDDQAAIGAVLPEEPLQMYFVRDNLTAYEVSKIRSGALGLGCFRFEGEIPLIPVLEDLELASLVSIDHFGGIEPGGYVGMVFKILELSMDIDNLKYLFKGIKLGGPQPT